MTEETPRAPRYATLADYLAVVRRYGWMILVITVVGAVAGAADALRQNPVYQANAQVSFQDPSRNLNIVGLGFNSFQTPAELASVNQSTATGGPVMLRVRRRLR